MACPPSKTATPMKHTEPLKLKHHLAQLIQLTKSLTYSKCTQSASQTCLFHLMNAHTSTSERNSLRNHVARTKLVRLPACLGREVLVEKTHELCLHCLIDTAARVQPLSDAVQTTNVFIDRLSRKHPFGQPFGEVI
mmetsp:Transcript_11348/g.19016  ORF Transcript_11348/g.19016 Transcript_11348/m.19016 type:complete len:136 (-) Transcript_11348:473-880(-)